MSIPSPSIGLDLLQTRAAVVRAEAGRWPFATTADEPSDRIPSVLLPTYGRERLIAGLEADHHRRGLGLPWPPEAQVPVEGEPTRGVGRVPVILAWASLLPTSNNTQAWGTVRNTRFAWEPFPEQVQEASAGQIIVESVRAWARASDQPVGLVVPDALDEFSQQTLLDEAPHAGVQSVTLIPRPMAIAIQWCVRNASQFKDQAIPTPDGKPVGHLQIASLGLDGWEIAAVEVRARKVGSRTFLVPVRNRPAAGCEIGWWGLAALLEMARASEPQNLVTWWSRLFGSDWICQKLLRSSSPDSAASALPLESLLQTGLSPTMRKQWGRLEMMALALQHSEARLTTGFRNTVEQTLNRTLSALKGDASRPLAVLVCGDLAAIPWTTGTVTLGQRLGEFLQRNNEPLEITSGAAAAQGAALAVSAMNQHLPSYRDTLVPIDIYTLTRDRFGDQVPGYFPLIKAETVEAGQEYRPDRPVTGLQIQADTRSLRLTLRRPTATGYLYKEITADIKKSILQNEPIAIDVAVQPGQGYAHAKVRYENSQEAIAFLDWKSMKEAEEPKPPKLSYLPGTSFVEPNLSLWSMAEPALREAIKVLNDVDEDATGALKEVTRFLNKWPRADYIDRREGRENLVDNPYRHYGAIGSDGSAVNTPAQKLVKDFRKALDKRFQLGGPARINSRIIRAGGWLYLSIPPLTHDHLRQRFRQFNIPLKSHEISSAGLAWAEPRDIQLFFTALATYLPQNYEKPNHWLRALRNIVRLREHALSDECLPGNGDSAQISKFFRDAVLVPTGEIFQSELDQQPPNFAFKVTNCLYVILYALKRRRYDAQFLNNADPLNAKLDKLLQNTQKNSPSKSQRNFAEMTLKFLRSEATRADEHGVLVQDDDGDGDE